MWALTCGNRGLAATRYARTAATFHAGMLFPRTRTGRPAPSSSTSPTCANTGSARPGMRGNRAEWPLRWLMRCAECAGPHGATVHAGTTRGRAWSAGATIYARRGTGFPVGAGERRVGPDSGIADGSCDRLCARGHIKRDWLCARPRHRFNEGGDGGARPPMRTFRHARGDLGPREASRGARSFMRSPDPAADCRRRPAADCPRTTGATAYAWITV